MKKVIFFTSLALWATSCATLVNGTKQPVTFYSDPSGADVTISQKGKTTNIGKTPITVEIPRKTKSATYTMAGYYEEKVDMMSNANIHWLYFLDCLPFAVPAFIDLTTGGHIVHESSVITELKKK